MTAQTILFANLANTSLAGAITNTSTTMTVQAGTGALFPSPAANQYFILLVKDAATGLTYEIMHVTSVTVDTFTIVRAQEGTTALNWSAGDLCANLWTAGSAQAMLQTQLGNPGRLLQTTVMTASGTLTPPTGWTGSVRIRMTGGGGAGGGTPANSAGGGGGSAAACEAIITAATFGASQTVTIGAGGTPGAAGAHNGGNGGTTSLGTLLTCAGGLGGNYGGETSPSIGTGGAAGVTVGGSVTPTYINQGQQGGYGFSFSSSPDGGTVGGLGAPGFFGGTALAAPGSNQTVLPGPLGGAGGCGACGTSNLAGGAGGGGLLIADWFA